MPVDPSKTLINHDDEPAQPPPRLEVGLAGWLRQNLFGSSIDVVITLLTSLLILAFVISFFDWAIRSANWFTIINNQRLFMVLSFEPLFEWRLALVVLLSALLTGMSLAAWARYSAALLAKLTLAALVPLIFLPPIIEAAIQQPASFFTAGNVQVVDRASELTPQKNLAFIAEAGETVSIRLALAETVDLETLSNLAGFSDRATNALANAARNRLEQRVKTGATFDQMLAGELTEDLEERKRLEIRTFVRTNDMLTATHDYVSQIDEAVTAADGSVAELRFWLGRLESAARALDPPAEAILEALQAVEEAALNLSMTDTVPQDLQPAINNLTAITLASEQLEDLGETLVYQLSEDFIGLPDQSDEDEELINPLAREAAFLRDMFVRLLTPPSVLDSYRLGQTPMTVAIRDAGTTEILAESTLQSAAEALVYAIPQDGWYILSKDAMEGEEGTAILSVDGVYPILERTLSATESRFVRLTDNDLVLSESRPRIDGSSVEYAALIDNQFRGLRSLQNYLIHFIPPFFEQVMALLLPFVVAVAWGYLLGRALAHLQGENSHFNSRESKTKVLLIGSAPLLPLLFYFLFLDSGAISGILGLVLQLATVLVAIELARRIEAWLNQTNQGEDSEGSLNRLMLYGWGIFPLVMYVFVSGIGGLSGAALGSAIGGLLWLLCMYFIGIQYRGPLGYILLVGGFFLQISQSHIINVVWTGWSNAAIESIFIWLALAIVGILAGIGGQRYKNSLDMNSKRYGFLLACIAFLFIFIDKNIAAADDAGLLAAVALLFWLGWMFFSGALRWNSTRIIVGLLLLTFLWMQSWIDIDRWSIVYFTLWLGAGALAFKRGEGAQGELQSEKAAVFGAALLRRFSQQNVSAAIAALWLAALILIPSFVSGLETGGILQAPAADLMPVSDKSLWGGLLLTMQLTILGIGASFPIGIALALGRRSNLPVVKYVCITYIEIARGVPLITVLFFAFLLVPLIDPSLATIEIQVRAWVAITMFSAAYLAENVRGGLQSLDRGQTEAAQAIGLSGWHTTLYILLPQALRAVIPALVGQFISIFKDTSLVSLIGGMAEITGVASRVVAQSEFLQRREETFLYVAIIYFVFSYIMSYISRRIEATGSGVVRAQQL